MYFDEAFEDVGTPVYPNGLQVYQGIAAAGGGLTQYLFSNGESLSLKKAYVGPLLPDGSIVASVSAQAPVDSCCSDQGFEPFSDQGF